MTMNGRELIHVELQHVITTLSSTVASSDRVSRIRAAVVRLESKRTELQGYRKLYADAREASATV